MKVYRGIGSILYKSIDPYYTNNGDHLVYGPGTSYSLDTEQARFYCTSSSNGYGWVLEYDYNPKSVLELYEANFEDLDNMCLEQFNLIIEGETVVSKNLVEYAKSKKHDCVQFIYDEFDQHILIIEEKGLDLCSILLYVEGQELVDKIKKFKLKFDGEYFEVPLNLVNEIDEVLENLN